MPVYGRFLHLGKPTYGVVEGENVQFIDDIFGSKTLTGESAKLADLEILVPVAPSKLFAIGLNYADHAKEHGNEVPDWPLMWFKAPSSLLAHEGTIEIAFPENRTDYEAELAIVIGKRGKKISEAEANDYIFGYAPSQDVSDRKVQRGESQWARGKSMDTYSPIGPFITTDIDVSNVPIQCIVNGEIKQNGNTKDMIFSPQRIVSFVSETITLEVGDVIMTGTPEGVGPLKAGDVVETRIGDMAVLRNHVKFAE